MVSSKVKEAQRALDVPLALAGIKPNFCFLNKTVKCVLQSTFFLGLINFLFVSYSIYHQRSCNLSTILSLVTRKSNNTFFKSSFRSSEIVNGQENWNLKLYGFK